MCNWHRVADSLPETPRTNIYPHCLVSDWVLVLTNGTRWARGRFITGLDGSTQWEDDSLSDLREVSHWTFVNLPVQTGV